MADFDVDLNALVNFSSSLTFEPLTLALTKLLERVKSQDARIAELESNAGESKSEDALVELSDRLGDLSKQVASNKQQSDSEHAEFEVHKNGVNTCLDGVDKATDKSHTDALDARVADLEGQLKDALEASTRNEALLAQLAARPAHEASASSPEADNSEMSALKAAMQKMQAELDALRNSAASKSDLHRVDKDLRNMAERLRDLEGQVKALSVLPVSSDTSDGTAPDAAVLQALRRHEGEISSLGGQLDDTRSEIDRLRKATQKQPLAAPTPAPARQAEYSAAPSLPVQAPADLDLSAVWKALQETREVADDALAGARVANASHEIVDEELRSLRETLRTLALTVATMGGVEAATVASIMQSTEHAERPSSRQSVMERASRRTSEFTNKDQSRHTSPRGGSQLDAPADPMTGPTGSRGGGSHQESKGDEPEGAGSTRYGAMGTAQPPASSTAFTDDAGRRVGPDGVHGPTSGGFSDSMSSSGPVQLDANGEPITQQRASAAKLGAVSGTSTWYGSPSRHSSRPSSSAGQRDESATAVHEAGDPPLYPKEVDALDVIPQLRALQALANEIQSTVAAKANNSEVERLRVQVERLLEMLAMQNSGRDGAKGDSGVDAAMLAGMSADDSARLGAAEDTLAALAQRMDSVEDALARLEALCRDCVSHDQLRAALASSGGNSGGNGSAMGLSFGGGVTLDMLDGKAEQDELMKLARTVHKLVISMRNLNGGRSSPRPGTAPSAEGTAALVTRQMVPGYKCLVCDSPLDGVSDGRTVLPALAPSMPAPPHSQASRHYPGRTGRRSTSPLGFEHSTSAASSLADLAQSSTEADRRHPAFPYNTPQAPHTVRDHGKNTQGQGTTQYDATYSSAGNATGRSIVSSSLKLPNGQVLQRATTPQQRQR